ncbi:MAG: PKD domain-containing protein [Candidatus Parcubacteria bacterium]|nr:PKD domain-containing protein [Candidatus Parcubacteria bacterium]
MKKTNALRFRSAAITLSFALMIVFAGVLCKSAGLAPLAPQRPVGSTTLEVGTSYFFSASAINPDSNMVAIRFDWGDGNKSDWGAYVSSGQIDSASHTWTKAGTFDVKAQAKNQQGSTSPWSSQLAVTADTAAVAYYSEGFEQESTWSSWGLDGAFSAITTGHPHTGNYSVVLDDTGSEGSLWYGGFMELEEPIDVRNLSSAVVSFWYNVLQVPVGGSVTGHASLVYLNNSGDWKAVEIAIFAGSSLDTMDRWYKAEADITPYCGIMKYAAISIYVRTMSYPTDEVRVAIDDIKMAPKN